MNTSRAWLVASILLICLGCAISVLVFVKNRSGRITEHHRFVQVEPQSLFTSEASGRLEKFSESMLKDLDVELVVIVKSSLNGNDLNTVAHSIAAAQRVGASTREGSRGLLLLLALQEKQVRFEVGYGLEGAFPDAFVGYIEREQMRPFFEEGKIAQGIEATIEMIVSRAYDEIKKQGVQVPDGARNLPSDAGFSGGAGAARKIDIGSRQGPQLKIADAAQRAYFAPAGSPEEAYRKYMETLRLGLSDHSLDLYSEASQKYFANWTTTSAQMANELRDYEGHDFIVETEGDLAVILFPAKERKLMPFFLKKERGGWVFDFCTSHTLVLRYNQNNKWFARTFDHPYMFAFNRRYTFDSNGFPFDKKTHTWLGGSYYWYGYQGKGVVVYKVDPGSPAERAGLEPGDFVLEYQDQQVLKPMHLTGLIRASKPGEQITLRIVRGALSGPMQLGEVEVVPVTRNLRPPREMTLTATLVSKE